MAIFHKYNYISSFETGIAQTISHFTASDDRKLKKKQFVRTIAKWLSVVKRWIWILHVNSLSASLLLNIFLSFEVGIAHAIANFKWKENTSSLKN